MKTMCVFFFLFMAIAITFAQAPETLWTRTYGGSGDDGANSAQQTADGGYIMAGWTASFGAGDKDFYLVKTDSQGDTLWTRTYGGSDEDWAAPPQQTTDGGYIVAGYTRSFGGGLSDMYLIKTNSQGDTLWTRTFGGGIGYDAAYSVQQTGDGGYIVAGLIYSGQEDFYLVRTNSQGDTLWTRTYGGSSDEEAHSIQQTAEGGYIVAGETESFGAGNKDFYLVKTDSQGDTIWTRTYGGSNLDAAWSVQQTMDGGYIVAGETRSFGAGNKDFYLVKTDSQGDTMWTRTYGGSNDDWARSVRQTANGGYVLAGVTHSFGMISGDYYLVGTNSQGDTLWTRIYGGSEYDEARSVQQTADGGYVIAGISESFGAGGEDFFVVKTASGYPNAGYVTLITPGPPNWDYRLNWVSGTISHFAFTNFCPGTIGSVSGTAVEAGWTATNYADSIVFSNPVPLTTGSIETFTLSHPWCSDVVTWTVGDSTGEVDGPLPVELISFNAIAIEQGIRVSFSTASETDNDRFEILRGERAEGEFTRIAVLPSQGNPATEQRYEYTDADVNPGQTYWYYPADVDMSGNRTEHRGMTASATALDPVAAPVEYALSVYPNPFNPTTTVSFTLPEAGRVRVAVYDVNGRLMVTLADEERNAGGHKIAFDARELPSGVYFVRMESGEFWATRKVVLMR